MGKASSPPMTPAALKRLKVADVREALQQRGLDASGTKDAMLQRYESHFAATEQANHGAADHDAAHASLETPSKPTAHSRGKREASPVGTPKDQAKMDAAMHETPTAATTTRRSTRRSASVSADTPLLNDAKETTASQHTSEPASVADRRRTPSRRTKSPSPFTPAATAMASVEEQKSEEEEASKLDVIPEESSTTGAAPSSGKQRSLRTKRSRSEAPEEADDSREDAKAIQKGSSHKKRLTEDETLSLEKKIPTAGAGKAAEPEADAEEEEEEDEAMSSADESVRPGQNKNAAKRKKKKNKRAQATKRPPPAASTAQANVAASKKRTTKSLPDDIQIEYVDETIDPSLFGSMGDVFAKFAQHAGLAPEEGEEEQDGDKDAMDEDAHLKDNEAEEKDEDEDELDDEEEDEEEKDSNRKRKLKRMSVAQLKTYVSRPDLVEWFDVAAGDPFLLMEMKSAKNAVPVPKHWNLKRKYLQNKRGIEKPPFELPDFIKDTGIMELRHTTKEKEDGQSLSSKSRAKLNPRMGKLDIDYQKLHDAFFRFQTKPAMSTHGEMYYEGKEYETKLKVHRPGVLSEDLKQALAIPPLAPPPWLINMQRFGPPPSYKGLKICGLNCAIPPGAQWGYHPGGWGRPPVDEHGNPLYGDVFGRFDSNMYAAPMTTDRALWGELEVEVDLGVNDEEGGEGEAGEGEDDEDVNMDDSAGLETPSGLTSVASTAHGLQTPDVIQLRKNTGPAMPTH